MQSERFDTTEIPGLFLLREGDGQSLSRPVKEEKTEAAVKEEKAVFCRSCRHPITTSKNLFAVDGSQTHTFFNPAGIIFEIACFKAAPGCLVQGEASSDFAWFRGFTWRIAFCGSCFVHLGWFFDSGDSSFYGLILKQLAGDL